MDKKKKSTKKKNPKINWIKAQLDYLASPLIEVKEWGRQYFGSETAIQGGNFNKKTTGWRAQKESIWEEAKKNAVDEYKEQSKLEAKIDVARAVAVKKRAWNIIEGILLNAMSKDGKKINIEMKDLEKAIRIAKTELGEESSITKSLNVDLGKIKEENNKFIDTAFNDLQKLSNRTNTDDDNSAEEDNEL